MPLLIIGAVSAFIAWKTLPPVLSTPQNHTTNPPAILPGWVIPSVVVAVGGVLLYKYGAKILKV